MVMKTSFVVLLGLVACSQRIDAIEEEPVCTDTALTSSGEPILLGEACYDNWARSLVAFRDDMSVALEAVLPHCIAVAEARGLADTWSTQSDVAAKAVEACRGLEDLDVPGDMSCEFTELEICGVQSVSCTSASPPPWLEAFEAGMPAFAALACEVQPLLEELTHLLITPPCDPPPAGVEKCSALLLGERWMSDLATASGLVLGGFTVAIDAAAP
jgi:hypothetical protein